MTNNKHNAGFTLIELSIVLVIIGLIVSGILAGQELIRGASVRATISQVLKYNTAVNTFYMKYNALPGDFSAASSYIVGATNGDGNGLIGSVLGATNAGTSVPAGVPLASSIEYSNFWHQLAVIGVIEGTHTNLSTATALVLNTHFPATKVVSGVGILAYGNTNDNSNYYHLGVTGSTSATAPTTSNFLSPGDAYAFDAKVDDGIPTSGIVVARAAVASVIEATPVSIISGAASLDATRVSSCLYGITGFATASGYNTAAPSASQSCQLRMRMN
jgi:prepilin-type N-terminal cleavage/methylation domain-containing protein